MDLFRRHALVVNLDLASFRFIAVEDTCFESAIGAFGLVLCSGAQPR